MAFLVVAGPVGSVYALEQKLDSKTEDYYARIGVTFYDPNGSQARNFCTSGPGDCYISGNTFEEKIWSGLRHVGFNPMQTAAIMGNILHEGGSPTRQEQAYITARDRGCKTQENQEYDIYLDSTNGAHHAACMQSIFSGYPAGSGVAGIGLGFVQWTYHGRRLGYLNAMEQAGLLEYFEGDAYKTYGSMSDDQLRSSIPEDDYLALWCVALKYIYTEMTTAYTDFFTKTTLDDMTEYVAYPYEGCQGCANGTQRTSRINTAQRIYDMYENHEFDSVEEGDSTNSPANRNTDSSSSNEGGDSSDQSGGSSNGSGGSSNQSSASSIQRSGDCSVPYNITTPEDITKVARQFIVDTNSMYGTSYPLPTTDGFNGEYKLWQTPNAHESPSIRVDVRNDWISRGIIPAQQGLAGCWKASDCGQCTALSGWFVIAMTDYIYNIHGTGNGDMVVAGIVANNEDVQVSDTPVPFSVFSVPGPHTGLVLGDFGDGTVYLLENNMHNGKLQANRRAMGSGYTYAVIPPEKINMSHMGQE